jgi:mxaJ protein
MCSSCPERSLVAAAAALAFTACVGTAAAQPAADPPAPALTALRVCADPDNPPYSQEHGAARPGFEVRIAQLLAAQMQVPLEVHWQPLLRGFVRKSLGAHVCDALIGVPVGYGPVLTTRPYYRSSYVFVTRRDAAQPLADFDDPRLPALRIGVPLVGDDLLASPPGVALTHRGAIDHVVGFTLLGGERPEGERIVQAVARGELDAALAWGPQVGWFAAQAQPAVALHTAVQPADVKEAFQFGIAVGVRKHDTALRDRLQAALDAQRDAIDAVLRDYAVPRVDAAAPQREARR